MEKGLDLILSSVCFNETFCEYLPEDVVLDPKLSQKQTEVLALVTELNGKHLKIGTYNNYPLSWTEKGGNGTLIGKGVAFIIVEILQSKFNFTYDVVVPDLNYEFGGSKPEDSLIGMVNGSKVDFGAAFIPALYDFQSYVKFSPGLDEGTWVMMLKRPKESAAGSGLLAPFDENVWYIILVAVLFFGPCITFLTRVRSKLIGDDDMKISLSPSVWFVYGAFIKQGTTLSPNANTTRVLFATWWIFIILLSAFYTANLTAFLTLSKFTLGIETPEDLLKKEYRWVSLEGGTVEYVVKDYNEDLHYLAKMIDKGRAEFRSFSSDKQFLPMVTAGAVLIHDQISVDHLMYGDYLRKLNEGIAEADRCTYVVAPNAFMNKIRAFAYPLNSTLRNVFDPVLTYLVQSGIVKHLRHKDLPSTKICPLDLQSKDRRLRNSDLLMTYYIMFAGQAAAIAVFIGEVFIRRYIKIKFRKSGTKTKSKLKKKFNNKVSFNLDEDQSMPPPYDSLFGKNSRYSPDETKTRIINGREYLVVNTVAGDKRLIPVRTPSAFLYQRR